MRVLWFWEGLDDWVEEREVSGGVGDVDGNEDEGGDGGGEGKREEGKLRYLDMWDDIPFENRRDGNGDSGQQSGEEEIYDKEAEFEHRAQGDEDISLENQQADNKNTPPEVDLRGASPNNTDSKNNGGIITPQTNGNPLPALRGKPRLVLRRPTYAGVVKRGLVLGKSCWGYPRDETSESQNEQPAVEPGNGQQSGQGDQYVDATKGSSGAKLEDAHQSNEDAELRVAQPPNKPTTPLVEITEPSNEKPRKKLEFLLETLQTVRGFLPLRYMVPDMEFENVVPHLRGGLANTDTFMIDEDIADEEYRHRNGKRKRCSVDQPLLAQELKR